MQNFTHTNAILVNSAANGQTMGVQGKLRGLDLQNTARPEMGSVRSQSDSYSRIGIGNPIPGTSPSSPADRTCLFGATPFGTGTGRGEPSVRRERAERWQGHDRLTGHALLSIDAVVDADGVFTANAAAASAMASLAHDAGKPAPVAAERRQSEEAVVRHPAQGGVHAVHADAAKPAPRTKRSSTPAAMPAPIWAALVLSRALSS